MKIQSLFIILFIFNSVFAQKGSISGRVTDINEQPLSEVSVIVSGTNMGTTSDSLGYYKLTDLHEGDYIIEASIIGYKKFISGKFRIKNNHLILNIILKEEPIQSEQVVVTAGKYAQRISELPVSAAIMSSKEISERNVQSLDYAMRYAPGVTINLDQVSIRGSSGYSRGAGTRVLVALDGIPFYTEDTGEIIWEILPVTEISRVEIIKGASSSLYGSTAIGGVINVITKEIPDHSSTYLKTYIGLYDRPAYKEWDWSGKYRPFNGAIITHSNKINNFGYTVSITRTENSSYKQSDYLKRYSGYLKTVYNYNSSNSLTFFANGVNQNHGNFIYWRDSRHALQPPDADEGQHVTSNRYMLGLIYKTIFSRDFFLTLRTSYYNTHWKDETTSMDDSRAQLLRGELQTTYQFSNNLVIVSGLEATTGKVKSNIFSNPTSNGFGIYSQIDYKFYFPLSLSIGARYDYSKLDTLKSNSDFSPKIGFNYKLSESTILRASAGKGFRSPTLAEAFTKTTASGITIKPNPNLKPEHNFTFEFGIRHSFLNNNLIDAAYFQSEYYDFIEPGIDPKDGLVQFTNLTRARLQGVEVNLNLNLIPNTIQFSADYMYLWARDIERKMPLKYRPRNLLYASLNYFWSQLELGADFRFWSKIEALDFELVDLGVVPDGDKRVPVYVLDLRATYNTSLFSIPARVNLNTKNILNYNYIEIIGNLSPIRNFSLSLEVMF
jgi:outer membrane receptor for ferrienterochelin and colicins